MFSSGIGCAYAKIQGTRSRLRWGSELYDGHTRANRSVVAWTFHSIGIGVLVNVLHRRIRVSFSNHIHVPMASLSQTGDIEFPNEINC